MPYHGKHGPLIFQNVQIVHINFNTDAGIDAGPVVIGYY